jgi:hypothetical protein
MPTPANPPLLLATRQKLSKRDKKTDKYKFLKDFSKLYKSNAFYKVLPINSALAYLFLKASH